MLNRESQKKLDYEKKQSKLELSNLKRMPKNFKMRLFSTIQHKKVRNHPNSTLKLKMTLSLTKPPTSLCL